MKPVYHAARAMVCAAVLLLSLASCGLADTAATGASVAASQIEAAKQAQKTEQQIKERLDAAQQANAAQRRAADEAATQ